MNNPSLIIIGKRRRIALKKGKTVIGRAPSVTVQLPQDPKVSWKHTEIVRKRDGYLVRDLESTNGTLVNGKLVTEPQLLQHNDRLQIGKTAFAVDMGNAGFEGQMSTTIPPERVQKRLDDASSAQRAATTQATKRGQAVGQTHGPPSIEPPTERYHFDPTDSLSQRMQRSFVGRQTYKSKEAALTALANAKEVLPPIESAYQPTEEQSPNVVQRLLEWISPMKSETKFCELTGLALRPIASAIYAFDAAEDLVHILYAWNSELLEYMPVATPEAQKERHFTRLVLWWHRDAETAYLEQTVHFKGKIVGSQNDDSKKITDQWLVASMQMDSLTAQRFMDVLA